MSGAQGAVIYGQRISAGTIRVRWGLREALLAALAIAYPFHFYVTGPGGIVDISVGDVIVAMVVIAFCLSLLWGRMVFPRYTGPVVGFMLVALGSLAYPLARPESLPAFFDPLPGIQEVAKVAGSAAWMVAVYALLRRNPVGGLRVFASVSVIAASGFAVATIHQSLMSSGSRPRGPFENENLYANYLAFNAFLAAMLARLDELHGMRAGPRVPLWLTMPLLLVGILATGSRGAIIGAALACPLIVKWNQPSKLLGTRAATLAMLALSGCGLLIFWQANPFIANRVSTIVRGQGPNIEERIHLQVMAIEAFSTSPVLGIGFHQFPQYAEAVHGWKRTVAHNTYFTMAAELGEVGLIAFAWLFVRVVLDAVRIGRAPAAAIGRSVLAIVVATLAQGLFANVEHYRSLWIAMGILAGIDAVVARGDESERSAVAGGITHA